MFTIDASVHISALNPTEPGSAESLAFLKMAADHHLRGADAVYAAVAGQYRTTLVTLDNQQLERLPTAVVTTNPGGALADFR